MVQPKTYGECVLIYYCETAQNWLHLMCVPIYVCVRANVFSNMDTFRQNKNTNIINWAVFHFYVRKDEAKR